MPQNLKNLIDEVLTVDDLVTLVLTTIAANVDLGTHPLAQQIVVSALAVASIVATVANKIKQGRVS